MQKHIRVFEKIYPDVITGQQFNNYKNISTKAISIMNEYKCLSWFFYGIIKVLLIHLKIYDRATFVIVVSNRSTDP